MFECQKFLDRMGWKQEDLAKALGSKQSRVSNWNTGVASPRYNEILKLIDLGVTIEELFGDDVAEKLKSRMTPVVKEIDYKSPEFLKGVQEAVIASLTSRKQQSSP